MNKKCKIVLTVNGQKFEKYVNPGDTLADVIREQLGLTGTKVSCDRGDCGACTVIMDGKAIKSCITPAMQADGKEIMTIEGLHNKNGLHPLQQEFVEYGAVQCGYCTPGMIMAAKALLDENPDPTEDDVKEAIAGNICRCTGYVKPIKAIMSAAKKIKER